MKKLITLLLLCSFSLLYAQNHDDVAVIINQNSVVSESIGLYFQQQRNIPDVNIIRIDAPTSELIDVAELPAIFEQIKAHITTNNLENTLNYLVTTKGLPLIVEQELNCDNTQICKTSLESGLCLLLSEHEEEAFTRGSILNQYLETFTPFSRAEYGTFLVTRLDAYTQETVFKMIDDSALSEVINGEENAIVLDIVNVEEDDSAFGYFDTEYTQLEQTIIDSNWDNVLYHAASPPIETEEQIFWYHTIGFGPYNFFMPNMNWQKGALATFHTMNSAVTFETHDEEKIYLVDFIEAGAAAGVGFVDVTYVSNLRVAHLFDAYFKENLNMAEAAYNAIRRFNIAATVIGDPKMSVTVEFSTGIKTPVAQVVNLYPNPNSGAFVLEWTPEMGKMEAIEVYNAVGAMIYNDATLVSSGALMEVDLGNLAMGVYQLVLETEKGVYQQRFVVE